MQHSGLGFVVVSWADGDLQTGNKIDYDFSSNGEPMFSLNVFF